MNTKVAELMSASVVTAQPHQSVEHIRQILDQYLRSAKTGRRSPLCCDEPANNVRTQKHQATLNIH